MALGFSTPKSTSSGTPFGTSPSASYGGAITDLEKKREAKVAAREKEARKILDDIIKVYSPGGAYGQGTEAMLGRQKTKDLASASQSLVSSGLSNTTQAAGLGKKWEEEVGMPTRAKLEDVRYGALTSAMGQKVGFLSSIEDEMLNYQLMAELQKTASSAPTQTYGQSGLNAFGQPTTNLSKPQLSFSTGADSMAETQRVQQMIDAYNKGTSKTGVVKRPTNGTSKSTSKLVY